MAPSTRLAKPQGLRTLQSVQNTRTVQLPLLTTYSPHAVDVAAVTGTGAHPDTLLVAEADGSSCTAAAPGAASGIAPIQTSVVTATALDT